MKLQIKMESTINQKINDLKIEKKKSISEAIINQRELKSYEKYRTLIENAS